MVRTCGGSMGKKAKRKPAAAAQKRIRPQPSPPSSPPASAEPGTELVPPAAAADEQEGATTAGSVKCRHVGRGVNVEKLEEKLGSGVPHCCWECNRDKQPKRGVAKKKGQSHGVQKKGLDDDDGAERPLWMCLACAHVGCEKASHEATDDAEATEKSFGTGHALEHSRRLRHPLVLQCGDGLSIWCFECKSSILRQSDLVGGLVSGPKATLLQLSVKLLQASQLREAGKIKGSGMSTVDGPGSSPGEQGKNGIVRGLMNLGNTCFFNSVMQNLLAVMHLQEHFLNEPASNEGPLTSALRRFFQEINASGSSEQETNSKATKGRSSRDKAAYNPKGLFGAICAKSSRFKGYQQQDSHELLRCLLDGLHVEEDARSVAEDPVEGQTKASNDSSKIPTFVDRFFGGQFASTVSCCECGHSSSVFEPFLDLSLPIPQAAKVPTSNGVSKRETKARKAMDRKKRPPASKSNSTEVMPAEKTLTNSNSNKESEPCIRNTDEASWLDYLADDWSDKEFAESTSQSDCITSISSDLNVLPTAITGGCEAPCDLGGGDQVTHSAESSSTTDEALNIAEPSAVILLPYWDESQVDRQFAQNEWEVVPAGGDFDGLADLFQEEEASVATDDVGTCGMNQEGVGGRFEVLEQSCVDGFDLVAKEAKDSSEPIIEESIVPMTLQGCLSAFTKLEMLSGDNAWACENCSLIQERSKEQNSSQDEDAPRGSSSHGIRIDLDRCSGGISEEGVEMATLSSTSQSESSNELGDSGNYSQEVNPVADEDVVPSGKRKPQKKSAKKELVRRNATQSLVIKRAPPVLTIHLKRFAQDWRGRLNKLTGHVAFEELLNLNAFQVTKDSEPCLYYLVGVVEHSGTMRGGHYVAYVRAPNRGGDTKETLWYYISDSDVRRATLEQVLRSEAYLLFYERS